METKPPPAGSPLTKRAAGAERRRSGRSRPDAVASSIGPVVDLSAGGMRVLCTRPFSGVLDVDLEVGDGAVVTVRASVKWRTRVGFRRFVIGAAFLNVAPNVARQITELGMTSSFD